MSKKTLILLVAAGAAFYWYRQSQARAQVFPAYDPWTDPTGF